MDRVASVNRYTVPVRVLYAKKMMPKKRFIRDLSYDDAEIRVELATALKVGHLKRKVTHC
jgi:hypothetical protein